MRILRFLFHRGRKADGSISRGGSRRVQCTQRRTWLGWISTLYFGGGTPSSLPLSALEATARLLYVPSVEEFTIEVNPEDVNPDAVGLWAAMGVNRVSMGVQSLVDSELKSVGRRHSADDAIHAIEILKSGGMENISADLIYGCRGRHAKVSPFR